MQLKPHCAECGKSYLNKVCPCRQGRRAPELECQCGRPASEIVYDELGEWPLCKSCLELEQDGFASMPLPDFNRQPEAPEPSPAAWESAAPGPGLPPFPPFDLTRREAEIARLYRLNDRQIAGLLEISPRTVQGAFRRIRSKLGLRSRYELRAYFEGSRPFLAAARDELYFEFTLPAEAQACPPTADEAPGLASLALHLTVRGSPAQIQLLLDLLARKGDPLQDQPR
jgi:DNA-binding CsgD family transcriptional regulator